ncbi:MAG TPA: flippase [Candidatus Saccharimonadales bacterium]|nr:flippase [Candidatus Saccharimonadales bacterium]
MHRVIFKNTLYQTLAKIITSGIGFILIVLIARAFGVSIYGQFAQITAFVTLFYLLIDFGFNAIFLQQEDGKFLDLIALRFYWTLSTFFIVLAVSFLFPYNPLSQSGFSPLVKLGIVIFSFSLFAQSFTVSATALFQKNQRFDYLWISQATGSLATLFLVILAIASNASLLYVMGAYVVGNFITAAVALFFTKERIFKPTLRVSVWKKLVKQAWPLGLMLVFNLIYFRVDILLLSALKSSHDVGVYSLAYQFFDFLLALPLFLSNSLYPVLLEKQHASGFSKLIRQYFIVFLLFSFFCMTLFWFFAPLFTFIRPEFAATIVPFRILLISLPFFFTTSFLQWIIITAKKQRYLLGVYFFSMLFNIILNIVFIPQFGYIASAVITGVSEAIVFVFLFAKVIHVQLHYE